MSTANEAKVAQAHFDKVIAEQAEHLAELVNDWVYEDVMLSCFDAVPIKEDLPGKCVEQFDRMQERGAKLNLVSGQYVKAQ